MKRVVINTSLVLAGGILFALCTNACGGADASSGQDSSGAGGAPASSGTGGEGGLELVTTTGSGGSVAPNPCQTNAECADFSAEAVVQPLVAHIVFDRSSSMQEDGKWDEATAALKQFFSSPSAAGMNVSLGFFPSESSFVCSSSSYKVPTVELGLLTGNGDDPHTHKLLNAIDSAIPGSNDTPTFAALQAAYERADLHLEDSPDDRVVVILVTDGDPEGCPQNQSFVEELASEKHTERGIYTYAIGLEGSNTDNMNAIAKAGGTTHAMMVGADNITDELADTLNQIKISPIACEFDLPHEAEVDAEYTNVCFTPDDGLEEALHQVNDASACATGSQWYFDNPEAPSKVVLCPTACNAAQANMQGKVEVVFGCLTIT